MKVEFTEDDILGIEKWREGVSSITGANVLTMEDTNTEEDYSHHRQLIDQVVQWALPENTQADVASCIVKAFMIGRLLNVLT